MQICTFLIEIYIISIINFTEVMKANHLLKNIYALSLMHPIILYGKVV